MPITSYKSIGASRADRISEQFNRIAATPTASRGNGRAVVVGASLAGLMAALAVARAGLTVTVVERSAETGRTGAALQIGDAVLERLTGHADRSGFEGDRVQTWTAVHAYLRAAAEREPRITIYDRVSIDSIGQDASVAWAITEDGRRFAGELLIGADGYRSVVRRAVAPERPDARFAGYVIWIGIAREADLDHPSPWPTRFVYDEANGYILLGSPLPAEDGSMRPGERRLGWAMYDAGRNDLLRRLGAVKGNVVHHTLLSHEIPKETFEGFGRSTQFWREPWRSAMRDCVKRRAVIGTPIAEYLPDTLINGRLCLVGDAAHVPTPMTANGFSSSLDDALSLGAALAQGVEPDQALRSYEADRLPIVRRIVQSGQDFSRRYAAGRV